MSWHYKSTMTIWPLTVDQYGQPSYGTPYTMPCDFSSGGKIQRDESGTEFVPSSTFWFSLEIGSSLMPEREWYVAYGDHSATPNPLNAGGERIRKVSTDPMDKFGDYIPDRAIYTG